MQNLSEEEVEEEKEEEKEKTYYSPVNRALIRCNGDCGSQFAKFVEYIVINQVKLNLLRFDPIFVI